MFLEGSPKDFICLAHLGKGKPPCIAMWRGALCSLVEKPPPTSGGVFLGECRGMCLFHFCTLLCLGSSDASAAFDTQCAVTVPFQSLENVTVDQ